MFLATVFAQAMIRKVRKISVEETHAETILASRGFRQAIVLCNDNIVNADTPGAREYWFAVRANVFNGRS